MADKPTTAAGYKSEQAKLVRATCLYVATKLGNIAEHKNHHFVPQFYLEPNPYNRLRRSSSNRNAITPPRDRYP